MENRYYTPAIEELQEGLEMEVLRPAIWGSKQEKEWKLETFTLDQRIESWLHEFTFGCEKVDPEKVRVKYLDHEDIESLGWEENGTWENRPTFKLKDKEWYLDFRTDGSIYIHNGLSYESNECIFDGFVKNKSRLSLIMEMTKLDVA